uniref:Uncharacterized protein n=1 Tax=Arion vulgaris TaxID=1028688 RepID=A0A0B6ZSL2_9EUPU
MESVMNMLSVLNHQLICRKVTRPSLQHITKHRVSLPNNRLLPERFARKLKSYSDMDDISDACSSESIPALSIKSSTTLSQFMEPSYLSIPEMLTLEDDDEIMV